MNLRQTLIWKILISVSLITILYSFWFIEWENYDTYQRESRKSSGPKKATNNKLLSRITILEEKLKARDEYQFLIINNPTALTRVVKIKGMEGDFQSTSNNIKVSVIFGREPNLKAIIFYNKEKYTVSEGDTIAGGTITKLNSQELVFVKGGITKVHSLTKKTKG